MRKIPRIAIVLLVLFLGAIIVVGIPRLPLTTIPIDNGVWQVTGSYDGMTVAGKSSSAVAFDADGSIFANNAHEGLPTVSVSFSAFRLNGDPKVENGYNTYQLAFDLGIRTVAATDGGCKYESNLAVVKARFGVSFTKGSAWFEGYQGAITDVNLKGGSAYLTAWSDKSWADAKLLYDAEVAKSGSGTWSVSPEVKWVFPNAAGGSVLTGGNTSSVSGEVWLNLRAGSVMTLGFLGLPIRVTAYDVGAIYTVLVTVISKGEAPAVNPFGAWLQFLIDLFSRIPSQWEEFLRALMALLGIWVPIILIALFALAVLVIVMVFGRRRK